MSDVQTNTEEHRKERGCILSGKLQLPGREIVGENNGRHCYDMESFREIAVRLIRMYMLFTYIWSFSVRENRVFFVMFIK